MTSIYAQVLGSDFARLHPQIQRRRFYEGPIAFTFPMLFSGVADVCEWYDERDERFRIEVTVHNRTWGPLFGYRGWFNVEWRTGEASVTPAHIFPRRTERRE